jgi:hypothetical protein
MMGIDAGNSVYVLRPRRPQDQIAQAFVQPLSIAQTAKA